MFLAGLGVSKLSLPYIVIGFLALLFFVLLKGAEPQKPPQKSPQPSETKLPDSRRAIAHSVKRIKSVDEEYAFRPYG